MGLKKGFFMGICQCLSQIFTFLAFTITFWYWFHKCVANKTLCWILRYGPELVRTDCANYTGGTVIVVSLNNEKNENLSWKSVDCLGIYWLYGEFRLNRIDLNRKVTEWTGCNVQYGSIYSEFSKFCWSSWKCKLCFRNHRSSMSNKNQKEIFLFEIRKWIFHFN